MTFDFAFLLDPNIVYTVLLISLWLSITAIYMPGTGVTETLAFIGVAGSIALLAAMPTNWVGVILVVVGVLSFLIMPFIDRRFAWTAVGGLALQGIGSVIMFEGRGVSLPLVAVIIFASLIYHRYALLPVLEAQRKQGALLEDQPLIGMRGYVQKPLNPVGTVRVQGETWTARSDTPIEAGVEVEVVERDGLMLFVEPAKQKRLIEEE